MELAGQLHSIVSTFKVGWPLFGESGGAVVQRLTRLGARVFLDLKFHDIPNTVANAIRAVGVFHPFWQTVHVAGGEEMLRAAVQAAREIAPPRHPIKLLGVTVLTSIDAATLRGDLGVRRPMETQVVHLARLALKCGLDGVVASGHEVAGIRRAVGPSFTIIVPGVRPSFSTQKGVGRKGSRQDQRRVVTPGQAIRRGATAVVVGRPIIGASDPVQACRGILQEIEKAGRGPRIREAPAGGAGAPYPRRSV